MAYIAYYADHCYHHYDDFISPKTGLLKSTWKRFRGHKEELKAKSIKLYLRSYSDVFGNPPALRTLLCQDVTATVEDIGSKLIHLKDGLSSAMGSKTTEPLSDNSCQKVKSVSTHVHTESTWRYGDSQV